MKSLRFIPIAAAAIMLTLPFSAVGQAVGTITTVAGGGPNNVPGTTANFAFLYQSAPDNMGNLYFPDSLHCAVFKLSSGGTVTIVAGIVDGCGFGGDGGPATSAQLAGPGAVALDASGNLFISDSTNNRVRRVDHATGVIITVAGTGTAGFSGDNGPATSAMISLDPFAPSNFFDDGVAVDASGDLFIADSFNHRIRMVNTSGTITTVVGTGVQGFNGDGPGTTTQLNGPRGMVITPSGELLIDDFGNSRIRLWDPTTLNVTTIAGTGTPGFSGDNGPAVSAQINGAEGVGVDGAGNVFIADRNNNRIRRVDATTGTITTVAGNGTTGFTGDGAAATSAEMNSPVGVSADSAGDIFIADTNNVRIREVDHTTLKINTIAGNGFQFYSGNGVLGTGAALNSPTGMTVDGAGNVLFADFNNAVVRKLDHATGNVTTIAGTPGTPGFAGDGGQATSAQLRTPDDIAVDGAGNIYVADRTDNRVRIIATNGVINTMAGNGSAGFSGDGGPATSAQLSNNIGVAVDASGSLFIGDSGNNRVRRVDSVSKNISTVAGGGTGCAAQTDALGDGCPATSAILNFPEGVAFDGLGNLFIADRGDSLIRRVDRTTQVITTVAGNGTRGSGGDGGPATAAQLNTPELVALDSAGDLFIVDFANETVRRVDATSQFITTFAGTPGVAGFAGDGGPATSAQLATPEGVAVDAANNLFLSDTANNRIRKVVGAPSGQLTPSVASVAFGIRQSGQPAFASFTLSNTTASPIIYSMIAVTGTNMADFLINIPGTTCLLSGGSVAAMTGTCTINVQFTPSLLMAESAMVVITYPSGAMQTIPLSGTGGQAVAMVTPSPVNFGNVNMGTPSTMTVTLKDTGTISLFTNFDQILPGTNSSDFSISNDRCGDNTINAGSMCTVDVTFTPSTLTAEMATLSFVGTQTPSPTNITLMGTGVSATTGFVSFTPSPGTGTQLTLVPGQTGKFTIVLTPTAGSAGPVTFTCTGNPPSTLCSVTASSNTLMGATPITVTILFQTNCLTGQAPPMPMEVPPPLPPPVAVMWLLSILGLALVRKVAPETRLARAAPALVMLLITMSWVGCAGSGPQEIRVAGQPTTPPGVYTITVTAASGGVNMPINLVVRVV